MVVYSQQVYLTNGHFPLSTAKNTPRGTGASVCTTTITHTLV